MIFRTLHRRLIVLACLCLCILSCVEQPKRQLGAFSHGEDASSPSQFDLEDIQANGELIVLTLYGPASYFEFRGEDFGNQYLLADAYAKSIGVSVRVEVCRTQGEMLQKLQGGDGDVVAYHIPVTDSLQQQVAFCGEDEITHLVDTLAHVQRDRTLAASGRVAWVVRTSSPALQSSLDAWLQQNQSRFLALSQPQVKGSAGGYRYMPSRIRRSSPIRNLARGEISVYDAFFHVYAAQCGWDWRLLAAQCYQESAFDPQAVSYMGAMGLMQLMPQTAQSLGVSGNRVFDPETNISAAVRFIAKLDRHYADLHDADERINFILAAYNAGPGHVDDARRLAAKHGLRSDVWNGHVATIALRMSDPLYYNDPVVRHGYFRGTETTSYVSSIRQRWDEYRAAIH